MKVFDELDFEDIQATAWGQAKNICREIDEADKGEEFCALIEELYPDGIDRTELNDILAFDWEMVFDSIGIKDEEDEEDEDEDEEEPAEGEEGGQNE